MTIFLVELSQRNPAYFRNLIIVFNLFNLLVSIYFRWVDCKNRVKKFLMQITIKILFTDEKGQI